MMPSQDKRVGPVPRDGVGRRNIEHRKPNETAVLQRLLEVHLDLSSEAKENAKSLPHQLDYEEIAVEVEDEIRAPGLRRPIEKLRHND
jgi:hypothetical protein